MSDLTEDERQALRARYVAAAHGMQSGVALLLQYNDSSGSTKHLRVGVNAAMADQSGLAKLLIAKGVFTEREYMTAMAESMEAERDRHQQECKRVTGADVVLA